MLIETAFFYLFAAVLLLSALMVISARNPVHSVLFLILAFFNASGLFMLMGAEFIAMIMVIVYVGAVAVLFLFVVMMLDINFEELRKGFSAALPVGGCIGVILALELGFVGWNWAAVEGAGDRVASPAPDALAVTNTHAMGKVLYTDYIYLFQASGLILLVAMIGAIVLTHRTRPGTRRQKIADQVSRKRSDVVRIEKVTSGTGVG